MVVFKRRGAAVVMAMSLIGLMASSASLATTAPAWSPTSSGGSGDMRGADEAAVVKALQDSAAAWSRGDLDAFMRCYEDAPTTSYIKADSVVHGYGDIRAMYASRFAGGAGMGRLSLDLLDYRPLGPDYALATGRYRLARPASAGGDASGLFTLVFHRGAAGWRIVSDHTS